MMKPLPIVTRSLLAWTCAALLAGCATTEMTSQWKNPNVADGLPRAGRVLVVCQARDDTLRRICEDQWAAQMNAQGVVALRSYAQSGLPPDAPTNLGQLRAAAQASGAAGVVTMQLAQGDITVVNPGPQVGVGVGSGSGYRGGGFSFGGLGFSVPMGGTTATQGLVSSTTIDDMASGTRLWSGNASTAAETDVSAQLGALVRVTLEAMKRAGVI